MEAGVSTACFYPMETREAFQYLAENGIRNIEIFFNAPSELKEPYLDILNEIRLKYGVKVTSVHPFTSGMEPLLFFSDYPSRFQDGLDLYRWYFRAAQRLGAEFFVLHGDYNAARYPVEKGYERIRRIAEDAERFQVRLIHENVARCKSCQLEYLQGLKQYAPEIGFVLDIKQAVRSQQDPFEAVRLLGNSILHVHMSDNREGLDCLPIGQGTMEIESFLGELTKIGFSGTILLELYRDNFEKQSDVLDSHRKLKEILKKVQKRI